MIHPRNLMFPCLIFMLSIWSGEARAAETLTVSYTSSLDDAPLEALLQLPSSHDPDTPTPLLVWVQGMYTDAQYGMNYAGEAADRKGWLVMTTDMRGKRTGGKTNLGAQRAQQDLIDALDQVLEDYNVDRSRVYLAGISMGGLTGGLTLENFPDKFAAGALLMGISDLKDWYEEEKSYEPINPDILRECGGTPQEAPEEYATRSLFPKAPVLADMPLMICHGRGDTTVYPSHAEKLIALILKHRPTDLYVYWFDGGHAENEIDVDKVFDFLGRFVR